MISYCLRTYYILMLYELFLSDDHYHDPEHIPSCKCVIDAVAGINQSTRSCADLPCSSNRKGRQPIDVCSHTESQKPASF